MQGHETRTWRATAIGSLPTGGRVFPGIVALCFLVGCARVMTEDQRLKVLSERWGNHSSTKSAREYVLIRDADLEKELAEITNTLTVASRTNLRVKQVYIINSAWVNAFTCPNGIVFITSGLLDSLSSRDELAVVLGHEITHNANGDAMGNLVAAHKSGMAGSVVGAAIMETLAIAINVGLAYAGSSSGVDIIQWEMAGAAMGYQGFAMTAFEGYSQDCELRADRGALTMAKAAGFDPWSGIKVMEKLKQVKIENPDRVARSSFVNAKPGLDKRIGKAKEYRAQM